MIVPVRVKRQGIEKTGEVGYNAENKSRLYTITTEPQAPFEQPIKEGVTKILIEFDKTELNSELIRITTWWGEAYISPNGKVVSKVIEKGMVTNEEDRLAFTTMFANSMLRFALNGRVRALEGHNDKPVFNAQGAIIAYTPEQEDELPTGGY